jgi:putative heme degradation protein
MLPPDLLKVLSRLPAIGKVMIVARQEGVTHERIGAVEFVTPVRSAIRCRGAAHDATIDPDAVATIIADRSGRMKDKALPRIDFMGARSDVLFSVVGLDGLEMFDAGLAGLDATPLPEREKEERKTFPDNLDDNDPGFSPFMEAVAAAAPVSIELSRPGITQAWYGVIAQIRPAMGFGNIMTEDFHLHLRAGTVSAWRSAGVSADGEIALQALDPAGAETGLTLRGPPAVFRRIGD